MAPSKLKSAPKVPVPKSASTRNKRGNQELIPPYQEPVTDSAAHSLVLAQQITELKKLLASIEKHRESEPTSNDGNNLGPSSVAQSNSSSSHTPESRLGNSAFQRIRPDLYGGESDILPWLQKLRTLMVVNGITTEDDKKNYLSLHLTKKASAWLQDRPWTAFPDLQSLEEALAKEFGLTEPLIASAVGIQNPRTYDEAKECAIRIEAFQIRQPAVKITALHEGHSEVTFSSVAKDDLVEKIEKLVATQNTALTQVATAATAIAQQQNKMAHEQQKLTSQVQQIASENNTRRTANQRFNYGEVGAPYQRPFDPRAHPYRPNNNHFGGRSFNHPVSNSNADPLARRDYSGMWCRACGQRGHVHTFRGCPQHKDYIAPGAAAESLNGRVPPPRA